MQRAAGASVDSLAQRMAQRQNAIDDEEMLLRSDEPPNDLDVAHEGTDSTSNVFFSHAENKHLRHSPILEISSSLSGAGKTQLLYYLTALAVLPRQYGDVAIGGQEAAVVYIDADDRFDADRLRVVAQAIVENVQRINDEDHTEGNDQPGPLAKDDLNALATSSLQHVHVLRPQSSSALLSTLSKLDVYLYDLSRHQSASRPLHLVVIDSATAFFWQDRLRDEVARTEDIGRPRAEVDQEREQKRSFYLADIYAELVKQLKRLQGRFGCGVVYTTNVSSAAATRSAQSGSSGPYAPSPSRTPALRPALPVPWGTFPTLRLVVQRDTVRSFPPGMSAHDARRDAPMRQSVIRQGKFSAWVNAWGREDWPRRIVDGVDFHNGGCFSFYVRDTGVETPMSDA